MKTIKVIDLFILLANKECDKLPKKIKRCDNKIFHLAIYNNGEFYKYENDTEDLEICARSISLNEELEIIDDPILNDKEKEYLSAVVRPFREKVDYIKNLEYVSKSCILIHTLTDEKIIFPYFATGTMYKNMEPDKRYTLEELGL